jgi:hypothetical protein
MEPVKSRSSRSDSTEKESRIPQEQAAPHYRCAGGPQRVPDRHPSRSPKPYSRQSLARLQRRYAPRSLRRPALRPVVVAGRSSPRRRKDSVRSYAVRRKCHYAPLRSTSPRCPSRLTAARAVIRETPYSEASSRSDGTRLPEDRAPLSIRSAKLRAIPRYTGNPAAASPAKDLSLPPATAI